MVFSGRKWVNNLLSVPLLRGTVLIRKAANLFVRDHSFLRLKGIAGSPLPDHVIPPS